MKKFILAVIFVVVIVLGSFYLRGKSAEERTVNVNASYTGFDCFTDVIIKEDGLLEKYMPEGVSVKWHSIGSGSEKRDALVSGALDISELSILAFTTAIQNKLPVSYLAYHGSNLYQLYAKAPAINTMNDLKPEHKISVSSIGTGPHTAFLLAATKDLGDTSRFKDSMIVMSNIDAVNALIAGVPGVDAVVCTFPTIVAAWNSDKVHLVRDLSNEIVEYGVGGAYVTRPDFAAKNPDIIDAFLKAYNEALDLLHNNKPECIRIMQNAYKDIDDATASRMLDYYVASIDGGTGNYDKLMDFLYKNGILEQPAEKFENIPKYSPSTK